MATTTAQLRYPPLAGHSHNFNRSHHISPPVQASIFPENKQLYVPPLSTKQLHPNLLSRLQIPCAGGGDGTIGIGRGGDGGGGSGGWSGGEGDSHDDSSSHRDSFGPIAAFMNGWRSRVAADPQFPFKVLMEEVVGVSSCVLGDMASRPNFGLNELDFVFSTLVVGSILNFTLMYLLAPTMSSSAATLPSIFASCPTSHMFEPGPFNLLHRVGTFVYKGTVFAAVGFAAGLVGTALSNGLMSVRKKMDPNFVTPNKPPPTLLNALTWAAHMGLSSNFRYQTLNGIEFVLAKGLPPVVFKSSVVVLRCLNNILGGMSFVILARLTGAQSVEEGGKSVGNVEEDGSLAAEKEKLITEEGGGGGGGGGHDLGSNEAISK